MRKIHLILYCSISILTLSCFGQNQNKKEEFDKLLDYCYKKGIFNGNVLVVGEDLSIMYEKSFGFNGKNINTKLHSNSQFLLASLSKQFTAMGIMILKEKGKLAYDDLVNSYLSDFPYKNITIRNLLNQTSGLPEYQRFFNKNKERIIKRFKDNGKIITNKDVYNLIKGTKPQLEFSPGHNFNYSNTNYVLLAILIEHITNLNYEDFMNEQIFLPLKMYNSYVYNAKNSNASKNRVYGYKLDIDGKTIIPNDVLPFFNTVGDGGIYSSTKDLYKWFLELSNNTLISKEAFEEAYQNPLLKNGKKGPYGFGWFVREATPPINTKILTHSGEFVGFSNSMFRSVENGYMLIMLSNNSSKYRRDMNRALASIAHNLPYEIPKIKSDELMGKLIYQVGIKKAVKEYKNARNNDNNGYDYDETHLNRLGYGFIKKNMIKEALELFILNVEHYPNSSNVYDSLGEAYLLVGEKDKALFNYRKSLELNPNNKNAARVIEKISGSN